MIITKMALPRRTFLRGIGATLALPLLDAMVPALSARDAAARRPRARLHLRRRTASIQKQWTPATVGADFELSPILAPLAPFRISCSCVSGLAHRQADSFGDGNGDHARGTGRVAERRARLGSHATGADVRRSATTVDQIAAAAARQGHAAAARSSSRSSSRRRSALRHGTTASTSNTISWRTPTTPLPMETDPRVVFERLFGDGGSARRSGWRRRARPAASSTRCMQEVGRPADAARRRRSREARRIPATRCARSSSGSRTPSSRTRPSSPLPERPTDIPETFEEHAKLMFDLQVLAFQADITRVFTMLMAREGSPRTYPQIGVPEQHHPVSHHRDDPELIAKKREDRHLPRRSCSATSSRS